METDTWPCPNRARCAASWPRPIVVLADAADPRTAGFQAALARLGLPLARVRGWDEAAASPDWVSGLPRDALLRIDSPGRGFAVEKAILLRGIGPAREEGSARFDAAELAALPFDKGRILAPRQWYLGLRAILRDIAHRLRERPDVAPASQPEDIALLFDKSACQARFGGAGVPVPEPLGEPEGFDDLRERMRRARRPRVFVKLRHGSAASGAIAYETSSRGDQAYTTVERVSAPGGPALYNTRRIRRLRDPREIAALVEALRPHGLHAEAWVPKAGVDGCACDLRVLDIAGRPRHMVLRMGRAPMTNLHLGGRRGSVEAIRARMPPPAWEALEESCARIARLFPRTLHLGIDAAVAPGFRRHAVLEANAFGDLLKGVRDGGLDTYEAEIRALPEWLDRGARAADPPGGDAP